MTSLIHEYVCEQCGKKKVCSIEGCQEECIKKCMKCLRPDKRHPSPATSTATRLPNGRQK